MNPQILLSKEKIYNMHLDRLYLTHKPLDWIREYITKGYSVIEIAKRYLEIYIYNNNYLTNTTGALVTAFIFYKNNEYFNSDAALYLYSRNNNYSRSMLCNSNTEDTFIFYIIRDIIKELDGDDFFRWLYMG